MNAEGDDAPNERRWLWVLSALLPGLASLGMVGLWMVCTSARSDLIVALGAGLLCGACLLPLVTPLYLGELGRRYVRAMHGGYQSVTPFVLMYCAANFVLWFCGLLWVLWAIGPR